jgi:beta-glucosidase
MINYSEQANRLVTQMTISEKASLCSGKNFWFLKGIERLGIPEIMVTDGPHGLRKQESGRENLGLNASVPSTCFPTASATACSFDRELMKDIGKAIAEECRQENVAVLLGPGINIKRSPLCGRNFEYFSEDPLLSGEIAAAFIEGVQSQEVGVSLKHFAANNQETKRVTIDSVMDERTFREIYLKGFELAVRKSKPWTVMCSYNRLFGEFASQNERLLTTILRKEWGFEGVVISDWGAVVDRVNGVLAGLDVEMPHVDDAHDKEIIGAVESGLLPMEKLDLAATRVTKLILKSQNRKSYQYDQAAHHALARLAAAQSAVLLKNDGKILPANPQAKCAIIGAFAKTPRYQGTGSSKILPYQLDNTYEELLATGMNAEYADGYPMDSDDINPAMINEACRVAKDKEIVFLFAGLPDRYEAEGFDRESMRMPANHVKLIEAVSDVNQNLVVVLLGGAPMEIPWAEKARAILLMYLGGQAGGGACADLLVGKVNPSGKLAESWPMSLEDNPSYKYFPGYSKTVEYREGLFVGYRYYDAAVKPVRYPFGYGLSYTQFEYSGLKLSKKRLEGKDEIRITCQVKNTGKLPGKEVVQLYFSCHNSKLIRPVQELKGFEKVSLEPGESKEVAFSVATSDLSYFNANSDSWEVENGTYEIRVSSSSRDIQLSDIIDVTGNSTPIQIPLRDSLQGYANLSKGLEISENEFEKLIGRPIPQRERIKGSPHSVNSTISDIQDRFIGRMLLMYVQTQINKMSKDNADLKIIAEKMLMDMPLRFLTTMDEGLTNYQVKGLVEMLNGHLIKGIKTFLAK